METRRKSWNQTSPRWVGVGCAERTAQAHWGDREPGLCIWEGGLSRGRLREVSSPGPGMHEERAVQEGWESVRGSVTRNLPIHSFREVTSKNRRKDL